MRQTLLLLAFAAASACAAEPGAIRFETTDAGYVCRTDGSTFSFLKEGVDIEVEGLKVAERFEGARGPAAVEGSESRLDYRDVWPGIDISYLELRGEFEDELTVKPGADPAAIRIRLVGATNLAVDVHGTLVIQLPSGELEEPPPAAWQGTPAQHTHVKATFRILAPDLFGLDVADFDRTRPLFID